MTIKTDPKDEPQVTHENPLDLFEPDPSCVVKAWMFFVVEEEGTFDDEDELRTPVVTLGTQKVAQMAAYETAKDWYRWNDDDEPEWNQHEQTWVFHHRGASRGGITTWVADLKEIPIKHYEVLKLYVLVAEEPKIIETAPSPTCDCETWEMPCGQKGCRGTGFDDNCRPGCRPSYHVCLDPDTGEHSPPWVQTKEDYWLFKPEHLMVDPLRYAAFGLDMYEELYGVQAAAETRELVRALKARKGGPQ